MQLREFPEIFEVENHLYQDDQHNNTIRHASISDIFESFQTIEDKSLIVNVLLGEVFLGETVFLIYVWTWKPSVIYCLEIIYND